MMTTSKPLDDFQENLTSPKGHFKRVVFYSFPIAVVLSAIVSYYFNHDYESEWITARSAIEMDIFIAIINSALLTALASTIRLSGKKRVANSLLRTFLCWFLLPVGYMIFVLMVGFEGSTALIHTSALYVAMFGPFLISLIWTFRKFRKEMIIAKG